REGHQAPGAAGRRAVARRNSNPTRRLRAGRVRTYDRDMGRIGLACGLVAAVLAGGCGTRRLAGEDGGAGTTGAGGGGNAVTGGSGATGRGGGAGGTAGG